MKKLNRLFIIAIVSSILVACHNCKINSSQEGGISPVLDIQQDSLIEQPKPGVDDPAKQDSLKKEINKRRKDNEFND